MDKLKEGLKRTRLLDILLFSACILLALTLLVVSLVFQKNAVPSIVEGSSTEDIKDYANSLLSKKYNADGYTDSVNYYKSQISSSVRERDRFNLSLDLAKFYAKHGDIDAGLAVLDNYSNDELPKDAKYYYYATYIYLYGLKDDSDSVAEYRKMIEEEKLDDYFTELDKEESDDA